MGQEIFLHPLSTKTTEIEVKIGANVQKKQRQKLTVVIFVLLWG